MSRFADWTADERRYLRRLNSPQKIQDHLDMLIYNPDNSALSPRWVMLTGEAHCFEGAMLAAAAFEFHGGKPWVCDLVGHRDDHHVISLYKTTKGWGSVGKSNCSVLRARSPVYRSVRELVMSYFDLYFNTKGQMSLLEFAGPIDMNRYNNQNWRTSDEDLQEMGMSFEELPHQRIMTVRELEKLPKATKRLSDSCYLGADPAGLFKP